eukprot:1494804-Rhodomonas_salina.1
MNHVPHLPAERGGAFGSAWGPAEAAVSVETDVAHAGSAKLRVTLVAVFSWGNSARTRST